MVIRFSIGGAAGRPQKFRGVAKDFGCEISEYVRSNVMKQALAGFRAQLPLGIGHR